MINRVIALIPIIFLVVSAGLTAQTDVPVLPDGTVTITSINLDIDGKTNPRAVLRELLIKEGKEFVSAARLQDILDTRASNLKRRRLFKEFEWTLTFPTPSEATIDIRIVDGFTLYPRPMIKYSSTTGFLLGLKVEYFNAFGTLTDQIIEAYWSQEEIKASLEVNKIALGMTHVDSKFEQFYGSTRYGSQSGATIVEYQNSSSEFSFLFDIPFGPGSIWSYQVKPRFRWQYGYNFITNDTLNDNSLFINEGFALGFNHGFFVDTIEWIGNFRQGVKFKTSNENTWYLGTDRSENYLESDLYGYTPLTPWYEISGRLGGFYAIEGIRKNAGDRLRGVVDYMTYGNWGVFINAQMNFRVIPTHGFMEVQLRPFFDGGYVISDEWSSAEAWEYCIGTTIIAYFDALPTMQLNIEIGRDLKRNMTEIIIDTKLLW